MTDYQLPDLPYDHAALEPYISGEIMELHHDKHHATYVKGINTAAEQLAEANDQQSFGSLSTLEKNLAFHLGGHVNHSVFWPNMSPDGGDKPTGELAQLIDEYYGSFDVFRGYFEANALGVQGSGWSVLTWDMLGQRPYIIQHFDHQGNVPICMVPLLMLDMWEHAYYLQYKNDKATFVKQWWNIVNWADVQSRFREGTTADSWVDRAVTGASARRREDLMPVVAAAQKVAGVVAARGRGDGDGARDLMGSFDSEQDLAAGALLLAEISLGQLHQQTGESLEECVRDICLQLESALS